MALGPGDTRNWIHAFVVEHVPSKSRQDRLRRSLKDIYSRASAGVHDDATIDEARYVFLATYLLLGEILAAAHDTSIPG